MRLLAFGAIWLLLGSAIPALAQSPGDHETPAALWVAAQIENRSVADFNRRCGEKLDPVTGAEDRWADRAGLSPPAT